MHAGLRDWRDVAAVVANHFVFALVQGKSDSAILAFKGLAAGAAQDHGRISAAGEQHHKLLFASDALFDFRSELARDDLLLAGFLEFLSRVDDLHLWQREP